MTADLLARMLFGHLVGDYLLQPNWMALHKKKRFSIACLHCAVWTGSVLLFVPELLTVRTVIAVFASHLLLDATGIVNRWLNLIGSRSMENAHAFCEADHPELHKRFMIAYTALVQTVADNTLHLLALYAIVKFMRP